MPKGKWISYSAEEMAWLEANHRLPIGDYARAFAERFGRNDVSAGNLHALRKRKGWRTGRTGCFEKGQAAWNKGKRCPEGKGGRHPNARKTQFKKGNRTGAANRNWQPVGTERISEDGYRERKVHEGLPLQSRWQLVHRIEWEAANGPVPPDHCLKCLDGDKLNTDPSNWECIPRALLPRLVGGNRYKNGLAYDAAAPEVRPVLLTIAKLEHAAREKRSLSPTEAGNARDAA